MKNNQGFFLRLNITFRNKKINKQNKNLMDKTTRLDTDWERMNKLENRRKLSRMKHRELEKGKE